MKKSRIKVERLIKMKSIQMELFYPRFGYENAKYYYNWKYWYSIYPTNTKPTKK